MMSLVRERSRHALMLSKWWAGRSAQHPAGERLILERPHGQAVATASQIVSVSSILIRPGEEATAFSYSAR